MHYRAIGLGTMCCILVLAAVRTAAHQPASCHDVGGVLQMPDVPEASGLTLSRRTPGILWSHNDSGEPVVFAIGGNGEVKGRVLVTGAQNEDWEDIAVGPCPQGTCLFIADIGDNTASRRSITIYRTAEPAPGDARTTSAEVLHATYPEGPQDAEALLVLPSGDLFIVTKGETGAITLYQSPAPFRNGASVSLARIATLASSSGERKGAAVNRNSRITDADVSPDGRWVALRTVHAVMFYDAREFAAGRFREVLRHDLAALKEPQGEGVALSANGDVWLAGEGGAKSRPGTLARLSCALR